MGATFKDAFSIAKGKDSNNYLIENGFVVSKKVFLKKKVFQQLVKFLR